MLMHNIFRCSLKDQKKNGNVYAVNDVNFAHIMDEYNLKTKSITEAFNKKKYK